MKPIGEVVAQSPGAGATADLGSGVTIQVSNGTIPIAVVPNVVRLQKQADMKAIQKAGYQVAVVGNDNKVSIRPVKVADRVGNMWIVTEGLKAGERVVVEGVMKLRDGAPVNPVSPRAGG